MNPVSAAPSSESMAALSRIDVYPEPTSRVEIIQTHISVVLLTDRFAYKLKKPVRYDFLDFSTIGLREAACREELRLNRRLAADVYLDVVPVTRRADGQIVVEGSGEIVDWLVKMRRLDDSQTLRTALEHKAVVPDRLESLAQVLATFYRGLAPQPLSGDAYRAEVESHVRGNLAELARPEHQLVVHQVKRIHNAQLEQLLLRPAIFDARVNAGRVIDGHGDLRPEHIYLERQPVVIDCVEYSPARRKVDALDDLGLFAMECERHDRKDLSEIVMSTYRRLTGDEGFPHLEEFYKSLHACTQAVIEACASDAEHRCVDKPTLHRANNYLELAERCVKRFN